MKVKLATLLVACAREKKGLVEMIDGFNSVVAPAKPWWKAWF